MAQDSYRLRGDNSNQEIVRRLKNEIHKLESQLQRLQGEESPPQFNIIKTYQTMIESRQDILSQMR
jgi:predicted nuclease with TOPRIM domain